ncbi:hypothetical protein HOH87_01705 [bacterium]|jgi:hypothetical protein|nr:hypothetical protein [bacterium]
MIQANISLNSMTFRQEVNPIETESVKDKVIAYPELLSLIESQGSWSHLNTTLIDYRSVASLDLYQCPNVAKNEFDKSHEPLKQMGIHTTLSTISSAELVKFIENHHSTELNEMDTNPNYTVYGTFNPKTKLLSIQKKSNEYSNVWNTRYNKSEGRFNLEALLNKSTASETPRTIDDVVASFEFFGDMPRDSFSNLQHEPSPPKDKSSRPSSRRPRYPIGTPPEKFENGRLILGPIKQVAHESPQTTTPSPFYANKGGLNGTPLPPIGHTSKEPVQIDEAPKVPSKEWISPKVRGRKMAAVGPGVPGSNKNRPLPLINTIPALK